MAPSCNVEGGHELSTIKDMTLWCGVLAPSKKMESKVQICRTKYLTRKLTKIRSCCEALKMINWYTLKMTFEPGSLCKTKPDQKEECRKAGSHHFSMALVDQHQKYTMASSYNVEGGDESITITDMASRCSVLKHVHQARRLNQKV